MNLEEDLGEEKGVPNGNGGIISNEKEGTVIGFVLGKANKTAAPEEPVLQSDEAARLYIHIFAS